MPAFDIDTYVGRSKAVDLAAIETIRRLPGFETV